MLEAIFAGYIPTSFSIRFHVVAEILHGFVDALGGGLGSMMKVKDKIELAIRIVVWFTSLSKERSSNWREFSN